MALLGGQTAPPDGFGILLCDSAAPLVHQPETELRIRITGLGAGAQVGRLMMSSSMVHALDVCKT